MRKKTCKNELLIMFKFNQKSASKVLDKKSASTFFVSGLTPSPPPRLDSVAICADFSFVWLQKQSEIRKQKTKNFMMMAVLVYFFKCHA